MRTATATRNFRFLRICIPQPITPRARDRSAPESSAATPAATSAAPMIPGMERDSTRRRDAVVLASLHNDNGRAPERNLVAARLDDGDLQVVLPWREGPQRHAEPDRHGFGLRIEPVGDREHGRLEDLRRAL